MRSSAKFRTVFSESQSANPLDPQAVAVSPYGWLMTHYGWLAGLSRGLYGGGVSYGGLRRIGE